MLHKYIKDIYCIVLILSAITLNHTAGVLGWVLAMALLGGALPMYKVIFNTGAKDGIRDYRQLRRAAARRVLTSGQTEPDVREVGR